MLAFGKLKNTVDKYYKLMSYSNQTMMHHRTSDIKLHAKSLNVHVSFNVIDVPGMDVFLVV